MSGRSAKAARREPENRWPNSPRPKTCAYLASIGIDPERVLADDVTVEGYLEVTVDRSGKRVHEKDQNGDLVLATVPRKWPSPEAGARVLELIAEDRLEYGNRLARS
jgi:hypothetical protein